MASRGVNKVIIVGNLGQDPEVRMLPNGDAVANITVATSESWRDKTSGEQREKTEWHKVSLFGKLAEIAGEYLKKGSQVYIEGQLQTRKWQDQQGQDRYTTEVVVQGYNGIMQMLGGRQQGSDQQGQQGQARSHQPAHNQGRNQPAQSQGQNQSQGQGGAPGGYTGQQGYQQQGHQRQENQTQSNQRNSQQAQNNPPAQNHQQGHQQNQGQGQYNEPPMDFDDDIPF